MSQTELREMLASEFSISQKGELQFGLTSYLRQFYAEPGYKFITKYYCNVKY